MSGLRSHQRRLPLFAALAVVAVVAAAVVPRALLHGQAETAPSPTPSDAVVIDADYAQQWNPDPAPPPSSEGLLRGLEGSIFGGERPAPQDEVLLLRGRCRLVQGTTALSAEKMVVWRRHEQTPRGPQDRLVVYLEGSVRLDRPGQSVTEPSMVVNLSSHGGVEIAARRRVAGQPATGDALFQRALERRQGVQRNSLRPTQLLVPGPGEAAPPPEPLVEVRPVAGIRRVRISPRSAIPFDIASFPAPNTVPAEQIWVIRGGVNILVDDVPEYGAVSLSADRMVIWTRMIEGQEFNQEFEQPSDTPFTVYMEGNIVIRQQGRPRNGIGATVTRAAQAVYDAREERALILNAEMRSFVPELGGDLRVRGERIRQLARDTYLAQNAWTTASQFGTPGYRLQASDVFIEPRITQPWFGSAQGQINPLTGEPWGEPVPWLTSLDNTFYIHDVPLLYIPRIAGPAEDPNIPIRQATAGFNSRSFGPYGKITWDLFDLLGLEEPPGARWDLFTDYYGDRGPGLGTGGHYRGADLLDIPGAYHGQGLAYYVHDSGLDQLGQQRFDLPLEDENRYWLELRHRHLLPYESELRAELGVVSDRNFLIQYFENVWDTGKDVETLLYFKQQFQPNQAWSILFQPPVNEDFFVTTGWYPQADHFLLGERLLSDVFTYYTHSEVAYASLHEGLDNPYPDRNIVSPIPYIANVEGPLAMTRHELDAPFNLGPVKVVPFAMGEASYFGEGFDGEPVGRLWSSLGVRSSLMFWRVYPYAQSQLLNVNGLAHKVLWELNAYSSQGTADLQEIPQYHEIDDNSQERLRQLYPMLTFGGQPLPVPYDPRQYAVRTGAGHWVSAPWYELVDDLQVVRLALRQRLQTKVGPPERLRIRDWMTLDLEASYFPDDLRDNFGSEWGLLRANYMWAIGERTNILANALYDPFDFGQNLWDIGFTTQRDSRGNLYLGLRQVEAPGSFSSQFLIASFAYTMSPKWNATFSNVYDIGENRNNGQTLMLTRVGADWLVHLGANYDANQDNAGVAIAIEPRLGGLLGPGAAGPLTSMFGSQRSP